MATASQSGNTTEGHHGSLPPESTKEVSAVAKSATGAAARKTTHAKTLKWDSRYRGSMAAAETRPCLASPSCTPFLRHFLLSSRIFGTPPPPYTTRTHTHNTKLCKTLSHTQVCVYPLIFAQTSAPSVTDSASAAAGMPAVVKRHSLALGRRKMGQRTLFYGPFLA